MQTTLLKLSEIVTTAGTQIRSCIDTNTIDEYASAMMDGAKFPPVIVYHDGNQYILADGFHRVLAATRNEFLDIEAEVRKGAKSDALKYALSANSSHGLKRTNADKRRSVVLALQEWPTLSNRELAKVCAVSDVMVADIRRDQVQDSCTSTRTGADGKQYPAKKNLTSTPAGKNGKEEESNATAHSGESPDSREQTGNTSSTLLDNQWREGAGIRPDVEAEIEKKFLRDLSEFLSARCITKSTRISAMKLIAEDAVQKESAENLKELHHDTNKIAIALRIGAMEAV